MAGSDTPLSRPRPAARELALPAIALFVLLALLYTFSIGLRASRAASITGDEPFYLVTTQSLLDDHDLDLRNQYEYETYRSFFDHPDHLWRQAGALPDGRLLSPHQPGLSILVLPGFALNGLRGAQIQLLLLAAVAFTLAFLLTALETGHIRLAWVAAAVTGLCAPAFVYATEIYPEMPAALVLVTALLLLRMAPGLRRSLILALVLTILPWLGLKFAVPGLIVGVAYLWRAQPRERLPFLVVAAISAVLYAGWHLATFGALTPYSSNLVYDGQSTASVLESHVSFGDRLYRIWGLFIDRRFGIGHWAPILLVVLPTLPFVRRTLPGGNTITALCVAQVAMATFVAITMMGWWFPGRMLIVVFPLFAVVLATAAAHAPRVACIVGGVVAAWSLGITVQLVQATTGGDVRIAVDPFDMPGALFQWPAPAFPLYTWWGRETVVLNALWVSLFVIATALVALWPHRQRLRRWQRRSQTASEFPAS